MNMEATALRHRAGSAETESAHDENGALHPDLGNPWVVQHLSRLELAPRLLRPWRILMAVGALTLLAGLFASPDRTWAAVLLAGQYLVGLGLGGVFLVAMHYLTGAGWSVSVRRIPEAMAGLLPAGLLATAAVLLVHPSLYTWITEADGAIGGFKGLWLSYGFVLLRSAIYAAIWIAFGCALIGHSRAQDLDGDPAHSRRNLGLAAAFTVCFALSYWLASVDWVMALEHHWYSTIFGVYAFAGLFSSALAFAILVAQWLRCDPVLAGIIREDHLHDLGKLLLGATTLWAYIWFSQYMLIWYANIPEETFYYVHRQQGTWMPLFVMNLLLNWVVPFFVLLPRASKRDGTILARVALVVLVGRWLDLYQMIFPPVAGESPVFGLWEIGITLGLVGAAVVLVLRRLGKAPLVPLRDPHLQESLHHHQ